MTYHQLLQLAQQTTSRKEAVHLIHEADKLRMKMFQQQVEHPACYGG